jgi:mannosylglycerate hydrolase
VPWSTEFDAAVFNPDPVPRTDVVRLPLDGFPLFKMTPNAGGIHPFVLDVALVPGFTVDGRPARLVPSTDPGRVRLLPEWPALDVEFVADTVPAFGWKRMHFAPADAAPDVVDDGREIAAGSVTVRVDDDGTLSVGIGDRTFPGLAAIEDLGDRGDTYDFDPVADDPGATVTGCTVTRHRHPSGIERLEVVRTLALPAALTEARDARTSGTVDLTVRITARVAPGVPRVDLHVEVDNPAHDHRLRLRFPTGAPVTTFRAATTLDTAVRTTVPPDDARWVHPAPATFPHQGWIEANGLVVGAPGLPEAEVTPEGTIAVTVLRAVGWLAQPVLGTRPDFAGPGLVTPEAQCPDGITADLVLALDPAEARAAEAGLRAVPAGDAPVVADGVSLVGLAPVALVLSALKPAERGDGCVLRVLNPTAAPQRAEITLGFSVGAVTSVRLDETPDDGEVERTASGIAFPVGPHQLRSLRLDSA